MSYWINHKWPLPKTLVFAGVAGILFLGSRGLYQTTEGRYAECARQTMTSGHWLDPVLNGHPHWTKPPLTYLSIMVPMKAGGVNTWTARAYLIPFMLMAIWGTGLLGRHLSRDPRVGELSALVFATSLLPLTTSSVISTDVPLTALLILAQAFFWRAIRTSSRLSVVLVWTFLGLAFITKGPPSVLVLPAMAVTWWLLPPERRKAVPMFHPGALALYFVIATSWYLWEVVRNPGLWHYWLFEEVVNRSASDHFNRNPHFYSNFTIYLPVLLFGCLPWGGWLMVLRWKAWASSWQGSRCARSPAHVSQGWHALCASVRRWSVERHWCAWAFAFPLLVFFLSKSKLPLYLLPLFGPLSVIIACGLLRAYEQSTGRLWKWASVAALTCWTLSVVGKGLMPLFPIDRDMKRVHAALLRQVQGVEAGQLAVFGGKPLHGLQFYAQGVFPNLVSKDELQSWLSGGRHRYIVLRREQAQALEPMLAPARIELLPLVRKWVLAREVESP